MNNKWTRVNKVAVIISYCLCVLALVVAFVWSCVDYFGGMIWLYALVSLVPVTANHIYWAMYIEMSENIVRISSKDSGAEERTLNDISQTLGRILDSMPKGEAVRMDEPWECHRCEKINPPDARFCQKCGNPKNNDPVKTEKLGNAGNTRVF